MNQIIGGWSTSLIYEARTGSPFGVIENNAAAIYPTAVTVRSSAVAPYRQNPNWRANVLAEPFFDTTSFVAPTSYTFGNLGRTIAIGPGAVISDLSVLKAIQVREQHRLQFRVEMMNWLNRANFNLPAQSRGVASFGRISSLNRREPGPHHPTWVALQVLSMRCPPCECPFSRAALAAT
ncbi:MAG: hypothetical protein JNK87_31700 [Bryobacterales bacterium]|nr:hypothetical protein [Bryobacterales bacterium]